MKTAGKKYQGIFDITPKIVGFFSDEELSTLAQKTKDAGETSVNIIFPDDNARVKRALEWMKLFREHGFEVFSGDIDTVEKASMAFDSGATKLTNKTRVPGVEHYVRSNIADATFLPPANNVEDILQLGKEGFKSIKAYSMNGLANYNKLFDGNKLLDERIKLFDLYVAGGLTTLVGEGYFDFTHIKKYGQHSNVTHVAAKQPVDYFLKNGGDPDKGIDEYVKHTKGIRTLL